MSRTLHPTILGAERQEIYGQSAELVPLLTGLIPPARPRSLYVHTPFCFHKCHYCDFYSIVDTRDRQEEFVRRLSGELLSLQTLVSHPMDTIFVGGGTPTLLEPALWERLLDTLAAFALPDRQTEFTVEANPETVTPELLEILAAGGVNRLSIGAQSFQPRHLTALERWHDPANVGRTFDLARAAGLTNLSLDLIFAIPGQSLEDWLTDLDAALDLAPAHISCYALTYEPNTPLAARLAAGQVERIDEDLEAEMFLATRQRLSAAGYQAYEISNFAGGGFECRHNLAYWRNEDWLTAGPSASGHVAGWRWKNAPHLGRYLASTGLAPLSECAQPQEATRLAERLMMSLRLAEGVGAGEMLQHADRLGRTDHLRRAVELQLQSGAIIERSGRWSISEESLLLADSIIGALMRAVDP
ncbi:MAG: radical SAM family heme chaperone HemW [Phycisphaerales bacterium]|nr:radical SAM family heme chaperone HemW [Phycisphaerales bacterium]